MIVCVTRIFRTLVQDVGTRSSVALGQIPIRVPTQFSCHKMVKATLKLKHGQSPYKCYRRILCLCVPFTPGKNGEREEIASVGREIDVY